MERPSAGKSLVDASRQGPTAHWAMASGVHSGLSKARLLPCGLVGALGSGPRSETWQPTGCPIFPLAHGNSPGSHMVSSLRYGNNLAQVPFGCVSQQFGTSITLGRTHQSCKEQKWTGLGMLPLRTTVTPAGARHHLQRVAAASVASKLYWRDVECVGLGFAPHNEHSTSHAAAGMNPDINRCLRMAQHHLSCIDAGRFQQDEQGLAVTGPCCKFCCSREGLACLTLLAFALALRRPILRPPGPLVPEKVSRAAP